PGGAPHLAYAGPRPSGARRTRRLMKAALPPREARAGGSVELRPPYGVGILAATALKRRKQRRISGGPSDFLDRKPRGGGAQGLAQIELTRLYEGQNVTVLTLPSQPKTAAEAETQKRVAYVG